MSSRSGSGSGSASPASGSAATSITRGSSSSRRSSSSRVSHSSQREWHMRRSPPPLLQDFLLRLPCHGGHLGHPLLGAHLQLLGRDVLDVRRELPRLAERVGDPPEPVAPEHV